ncbi:MAG: cupin domain-containing protein [Chloroflexi bacterium]|nr:cupin domain-containing protein [Chloroflexota bacterium]
MHTIVLPPGAGETFRATPEGDHCTYKVVGQDAGGRYALMEYVVQPLVGTEPPPTHWHDTREELWFILEGELMMVAGHDTVEATPGTTVFVPRFVPHTFWVPGDKPVRFLTIFSPAGPEAIFKDRDRIIADKGTITMEDLIELGKTYGTYLNNPPGWK